MYLGGPGLDSMSPPKRSSLGTQGDRCPSAEKTVTLEGKNPRGVRVVRFAEVSSSSSSRDVVAEASEVSSVVSTARKPHRQRLF